MLQGGGRVTVERTLGWRREGGMCAAIDHHNWVRVVVEVHSVCLSWTAVVWPERVEYVARRIMLVAGEPDGSDAERGVKLHLDLCIPVTTVAIEGKNRRRAALEVVVGKEMPVLQHDPTVGCRIGVEIRDPVPVLQAPVFVRRVRQVEHLVGLGAAILRALWIVGVTNEPRKRRISAARWHLPGMAEQVRLV